MDIRVLVVDDAEYMRQMVIMMLKKIHIHDILQAGSGADALNILESGVIDLVLLDCVMPKEDGFHVLKAIRANSKIAKTPVILVTGYADKDLVAKAQQPDIRADWIIAKPLSLATLEGKIVTVMSHHKKTR